MSVIGRDKVCVEGDKGERKGRSIRGTGVSPRERWMWQYR